jgi:thiol-disulfide isomerase/thioredoxin
MLLLTVGLFVGGSGVAQEKEQAELKAIEELFRKAAPKQEPTAQDIISQRENAKELVAKTKEFLKTYPKSDQTEDVHLQLSHGLYLAALAGDTDSAKQLHERVDALLAVPELSNFVKQQTCVLDVAAQWGIKHGKHDVDSTSLEGQKIFVEGLFVAADKLEQKEDVFKYLLLLARSSHDLEQAEVTAFAQRIKQHPGASPWVKAEAEKILNNRYAYEIGKPIHLEFTAVDGRKVDLQKLKGKVVMVNFWASWCGPCLADLPELKAAYDKHHAQGLEVIGISLDEDRAEMEAVLKKYGITWPQYFDGKGWQTVISLRFGIKGANTLCVLDKNGILRTTNHYRDAKSLGELFNRLMAEEPEKTATIP